MYATLTGAKLTGGEGNDLLLGSRNADIIVGGAGDDVLRGDAPVVVVTPATPHQATVTMSGVVEIGDLFSVTVNGTVINFTSDSNVLGTAATNFAAAIQANPAMVAAGITASAVGGVVTLSNAAGTAFNVTAASATNATAVAEVTDLAIPAGTYDRGDVVSITLFGDGTPSTYTVQAGDDLAAIVAGIVAAINADVDVNPAVTASASPTAGSVRITSDVPGTAVTFTASTITDVTPQNEITTVSDNGYLGLGIALSVNGIGFATPHNSDFATTVNDFVAAHALALLGLGVVADNPVADLILTGTGNVGFTVTSGLADVVITETQPALVNANNNVNAGPLASTTITANVAAGGDNTQALVNNGTTQTGVAEVSVGGVAADTLTGGAGNDVFVMLGNGDRFDGAAFQNGSTFITMDTITDLNLGGSGVATRVDVLDLDFGVTILANGGNAVAMSAAATNLVNAVAALYAPGGTLVGAAAGTAGLFTYAGDSFIIVEADGVGDFNGNAGDIIVKVTGVTGTLDVSDFIY